MCTITFIPKSKSDFLLTSNRDESPGRQTFPPMVYVEEGVRLQYPKDAVAGGTWIGASHKKRIASLMNGGFVAHERLETYKKSRGLVLKDLLKSDDLEQWVENYEFSEIEPFTVIAVEFITKAQIFELVWDGVNLHLSKPEWAPKIWSSSPLYPENLKKKREQWFVEFLGNIPNPSAADILQFHKTGGAGDLNSNLIMDRGFVKTKSITQISANNGEILMRYEDLEKNSTTFSDFKT